jgi:ribosomal protein S25
MRILFKDQILFIFMENKKIGILLIIISLVVGGLLFFYNSELAQQSQKAGCFENPECTPIEKNLSITHFAIGVFSFILALGVYLLLFNKTDQKIMQTLESQKNQKIKGEKFKYILMALDEYERKVMRIVKEQDGITQSTLRLKTDMSKAKLSYVLQELEKRNLIKRIKKGKTLSVHLKI